MAKAGSKVTLTEATTSPWIPVDPHVTPFQLTVVVGVSGSGATASDIDVQGTIVDVIGGGSPAAIDIFELVSAKSASTHFNVDGKPLTAVRMNIVTLGTAGTAHLTVLQAGN